MTFPTSYHLAWLRAHPDRSLDWLGEKLKDGFQVHHVDGDHSNDAPNNLILMDGTDHLRLHSGTLGFGIRAWRSRQRKPKPRASAEIQKAQRIYEAKSANPEQTWRDFAITYHGGQKPDDRIWSDVGMGLQSRARAYARRSHKPWPPIADPAG